MDRITPSQFTSRQPAGLTLTLSLHFSSFLTDKEPSDNQLSIQDETNTGKRDADHKPAKYNLINKSRIVHQTTTNKLFHNLIVYQRRELFPLRTRDN